jgi:hypothetical protein
VFVGLDVGQARDRAVLVVIRADGPRVGFVTPRPRWRVEAIHTAPTGTPYPALVRTWARVLDVAASAWGAGYAAVDASGVGRPVVDMLREAGADRILDPNLTAPQRVIAVTATGGKTAGGVWPNVTVPAATLHEHLWLAVAEQEAVSVPAALPGGEILLAELAMSGSAGRDGAGGHFDHMTALSLAVWLGDHIATMLSERELRHAE